MGILIKNPKLLDRLVEVLPFSWEKGKEFVKQTVGSMKKMLQAIAGVQGISSKPLPKLINQRRTAKRRREKALEKRKLREKELKAKKPKAKKDGSNSSI